MKNLPKSVKAEIRARMASEEVATNATLNRYLVAAGILLALAVAALCASGAVPLY
jgi:hypothetical protein